MITFLAAHQLNFMQALSGICATVILLLVIAKALTRRRRFVIILMTLTAMLLISFDRLAYIYSGDMSDWGFVMVRLSNFIVFFMTSGMVFSYNLYIIDLLTDEGKMSVVPLRLKIVSVMACTGMLLIIISQFTGIVYYFDEDNTYHRAPAFLICYILPVLSLMIQFSVIRQYRRLFSRFIYISLQLFIFCPVTAAIIQIWAYGLSLVNIAMVFVALSTYVFSYLDINEKVERASQIEIEYLREGQSRMQRLFNQTATAFVEAIDARGAHSHGHSQRVADYARKLAEMDGKDEETCNEIYYAALLHDVGKVGTPDRILKKEGEFTPEEEEEIRQEPFIANQILSKISELPYLSRAAYYYHERYDGKGYPEGLSGSRIPEIARIITVADAYDAMTSKSDRNDPMPQTLVREALVRNSGTVFDPRYASLMLQLVDSDSSYQMREEQENVDALLHGEFTCLEYRSIVTYGIAVTTGVLRIRFRAVPVDASPDAFSAPAVILFDSLDERIHDTEQTIEATRYAEYGELWFDGRTICTAARNMETSVSEDPDGMKDENLYEIESVRTGDHVRIRLFHAGCCSEVIVALPDNSRFAYIALTGENCRISDIELSQAGAIRDGDEIPRIADEISYINRLQSDLPNLQIEGYRLATSPGVRVNDGLRIVFHTMSLPAANLVWHCPYVILFGATDGDPSAPDFREYALIRFDGEEQETGEYSENELECVKTEAFTDWDAWKALNKKGYECRVAFYRFGSRITTVTENGGISIKNITRIKDGAKDIYAAVTGDLCALTDIRVLGRI